MTIVQDHKANFETLQNAFENGDVALIECQDRKTGEVLAVICAAQYDGEEILFTPFCSFFNGNPYEILSPFMGPEETGTMK